VILAGRRINDGMGKFIAEQTIKHMIAAGSYVKGAKVNVLGLTFKENCPDLRNTRVVDILAELADYDVRVEVWDPWIDPAEARAEYGLDLITAPGPGAYDAIVLAVAHEQFVTMGAEAIRAFGRTGAVLFDVKSVLPKGAADQRL
jgi:UDP-N-acetyl-D-galactosamine dehydrogenase